MARYRPIRAPRPSAIAVAFNYATNVAVILIVGVTLYLAWPTLKTRMLGAELAPPLALPTAQIGNVGGQAPPSVRGSYADSPPAIATPIPGIAQSAAESQAMYEATAQAARTAPESAPAVWSTAIPAPLPLNSAGAPIIDRVQQQQIEQSAQMAADEQQAALRAAQLADAASRAPDVSYADAVQLLHRDPCHVPRADPATCSQGLFKPTPIGATP
jgi:hypothetical protein